MKQNIVDKNLPLWLRVLSWVFLSPVLLAPLVFYGSIFLFDNPPSELEALGIFFLINSYSLWLIGVVKLSGALYRRYHKVYISVLPHAFLILIISLLISWISIRPVDPSTLDEYDYRIFRNTPVAELATAVQANDTMEINRILSTQPTLVNYQETIYGQSLLMFACMDGHLAIVRALLRHGANPNLYEWGEGKTALISLCNKESPTEEQLKIAEELLRHGAMVKPMRVQLKESQRISSPNAGDTISVEPLSEAASWSTLPIVKLLLQYGADVNYQGQYTIDDIAYNNPPAVALAMISEHYPIVVCLLEHDANPHLTFYQNKETLLSLVEKKLKEADLPPYDRAQIEQIKRMITAYDREHKHHY